MSLPRAFEEFDTWARTVMGEARGESWEAQTGVAWVILNRLLASISAGRPLWWGGSVVDVCLRPFQFSCWNANDPNRAVILAATIGTAAYRRALGVVLGVDARDIPDPTKGGTHYHDTSILEPSWAKAMSKTVQLGRLVFYRESEGTP